MIKNNQNMFWTRSSSQGRLVKEAAALYKGQIKLINCLDGGVIAILKLPM
jgi:hypothetical protein